MTTFKDPISAYITNLFVKQDLALQKVWIDTPRRGLPAISILPEEGRFIQFLVRACRVKKALEIGTLGGYSGIWIARGLAPDGQLITLEKEAAHAQIAREHFELAGVSAQVDIRIGNAHQLLPFLETEAPFDFIFIDAEKSGYMDYFEWAMENMKVGGILAAHNALRGGRVAMQKNVDENTRAIQAFNRRVADDPRLISTIYPAGDGMLVAAKVA